MSEELKEFIENGQSEVVAAVEKGEKIGIKEIKEVLDALEEIAVLAVNVTKDKRISLDDWSYLKNFSFDELLKAWEGKEKIPAEAGDLDAAEVSELVNRLLGIVARVVFK